MTKEFILIMIFCSLSYLLRGSNEFIIVEATRYNIYIKNVSAYHLEVHLESSNKNKKNKILQPSEALTMPGNYSKKKLKQMKIVCEYNNVAFDKDHRKLQNDLARTQAALKKRKESLEEKNMSDLKNQLLAEAASNFRIESDNWFLQIASRGIRFGGRLVKTVYELKEVLSQINAMNYKSYDELIIDYLSKKFEAKAIKEVSDIIEQEIGLNSKTSEYVITSILSYLTKATEIEEEYIQKLGLANVKYEEAYNKIFVLKNDRNFEKNHTYAFYSIVKKPINLRTKTPTFTLSIEPLSYGNDLNTYWKSPSEKILESGETEEEINWGDGLFNSTVGGTFKIAVSPEIVISKKFYSRLYAGVSYYNTSYKLENINFNLSRNFFSSIPSNAKEFTVSEPLSFEHSRLSLDIALRFFIGKNIFFDLSGGYFKQSGILNLRNAKLSEGYEWASNKISIVQNDFSKFWGAKIGIGRNAFHKGTHLSCGFQLFEVLHTNETDYRLTETATDKKIDFHSNGKIIHRFNIGITTSF